MHRNISLQILCSSIFSILFPERPLAIMYQNGAYGLTLVVKSNSFICFFGRNVGLKKSFRLCLTFSTLETTIKFSAYEFFTSQLQEFPNQRNLFENAQLKVAQSQNFFHFISNFRKMVPNHSTEHLLFRWLKKNFLRLSNLQYVSKFIFFVQKSD